MEAPDEAAGGGPSEPAGRRLSGAVAESPWLRAACGFSPALTALDLGLATPTMVA